MMLRHIALNVALRAADDFGDIRADIVNRTRALATKIKTTSESIVGLGLEQGEAAILRKLSCPTMRPLPGSGKISRRSMARSAQTAAKARFEEELQGLESRIEELALGRVVATTEEFEAIRAARDAVWAIPPRMPRRQKWWRTQNCASASLMPRTPACRTK